MMPIFHNEIKGEVKEEVKGEVKGEVKSETKSEKNEEMIQPSPTKLEKMLIIGGTGSLGSFLIKRYYNRENCGRKYKLYILSRDENKHWELKMKYPDIEFILGDMRDYDTMFTNIKYISPDVIIIAGALKHIDICENNISQTIKTNILGVENIVNCVLKIVPENLRAVLFVSTDKACSPVNVYGMSKAIAERIVTNASTKCEKIKFLCVRYGNVLNSRGSILPKYRSIGITLSDEFFPITDVDMTRFFMRLEDSVELIHNSIEYANSGETIIPILNSFKISEVAKVFSTHYNKPVKVVGIRVGEKLDECLINIDESHRTETRVLGDKKYYVIHPNGKSQTLQKTPQDIKGEYTSRNVTELKRDLITDYL